MNDIILCKTCRKPKANFNCGSCEEALCKSCANFVGEDRFSFLKKVPADLKHPIYCSQCFDEKVAGPMNEYDALMEKAKEVMVFTTDQRKMTGHLKRKEDQLSIEDCEDEEEIVMRLAFLAAKDNFNCLLDLNISHRKIIVGSHKKTIFSATATPITIDPAQVREQF